MGRPTKLDELAARRIVEAIERGNTLAASARLGGVDPATLRAWCARGRAEEQPFLAFLARLKKAEAKAEDEAVSRIRAEGFKGTWQALAWWLERRRPQAWARRDPSRAQVDVPAALAGLSDAQVAERLVDAAVRYGARDPELRARMLAKLDEGAA